MFSCKRCPLATTKTSYAAVNVMPEANRTKLCRSVRLSEDNRAWIFLSNGLLSSVPCYGIHSTNHFQLSSRPMGLLPAFVFGRFADEFDEEEENKLIYSDIFQRFTCLVGEFSEASADFSTYPHVTSLDGAFPWPLLSVGAHHWHPP